MIIGLCVWGGSYGLGCSMRSMGRDFEYLHTSHRRYFGGHSSSQLARLHMHTRWGSPWGAPGINMPCYNAMGPHTQTGCRENGSGKSKGRDIALYISSQYEYRTVRDSTHYHIINCVHEGVMVQLCITNVAIYIWLSGMRFVIAWN